MASLEGAFDISSSESSSIIFRIVSSRSLFERRVDLGLGLEAVVEGMKSSSCSDSEASRIGSVGDLVVGFCIWEREAKRRLRREERDENGDLPSTFSFAPTDKVLASVSSFASFGVGALVLPKDLKMLDVSFLRGGFFSGSFLSAGLG